MRTIRALCAIVVVAGALGGGQAAAAAVLPAGYVDEAVLPPGVAINSPTAFAFTPTGVLLMTSQGGTLHAHQLGSSTVNVALDLRTRVCTDVERGLLGVAVDPNFAANRFIYVFYTFKRVDCGTNTLTGPVNRVSRFVLDANNNVNVLNETVLIDGIPNKGGAHNAGDLRFGKDGYLYASSGDGSCDYNGTGCGGQNDAARDRNTLLGKIVRITRDGAIPPGNPFAAGARCNRGNASAGQTCAEIFATGLRNPFRFAFDPNAAGTRFFINDVGQSHWEEINEGRSGADYGWNVREGHCVNGSYTNCPLPPLGMTDPTYDYRHDTTGCAAVTGGAFVPNGVWPAPLSGSYLFSDFTCGKIMRLVPKTGGGYTHTDFITGQESPVTHMDFGPVTSGGQALYYTSFFDRGVRRIRYVGNVNRPPDARLAASPTFGALPLAVSLDATGSSDPDGDALTYIFDFGDASPTVTSSAPTVAHTYTTTGPHTASVVARDAHGAQSQPATITIHAGNTAPAITVESPAPDYRFAVDDDIVLRVTATDGQEGTLPGSAIVWNVRKRHADHFHPFLSNVPGNEVHVTAPAPEDLWATLNTWLEARVTATDSTGLTTERVFEVRPKVVDVGFDVTASQSLKAEITVNGFKSWTPFGIKSWAGYDLNVTAPATRGLYKFQRWTDYFPNPTRVIDTPAAGGHYVAYYKVT